MVATTLRIGGLLLLLHPLAGAQTPAPEVYPPLQQPLPLLDGVIVETAEFRLERLLVESANYINAEKARKVYGVSGTGLTVAILDTGINTQHVDFLGKIYGGTNLAPDPKTAKVDPADIEDDDGHGSHICGIVGASSRAHMGIAPDCKIAPIRIAPDVKNFTTRRILSGLKYVLQNHEVYSISVVVLSCARGDYTIDFSPNDPLFDSIDALRKRGIPVVVSAGNCYQSRAGMGYPAILRQTISVGAVYDANLGGIPYEEKCIRSCDGSHAAKANSTDAGRITPFTQRMDVKTFGSLGTDIFAPGAIVVSSGMGTTSSRSLSGTSQAAPMVAGVILLLQEFSMRKSKARPSVDELERWLRAGANWLKDGDDEDDTVCHTDQVYPVLDAMGALQAADAELSSRP